MRVLVLGGYGLIGLEIVRRLRAGGVDVTGLGRSARSGRRAAPDIRWIGADIAGLTTPASWGPHLVDVDAVVNAAGALQDGAKDNVARVHDTAIRALVAACEAAGVRRFVQISAPGATSDASTAFLRTKAAADQALRDSGLDWVIFKPGLVIAATAYGGTSLVRMLAAFPIVQPLVFADATVQTVAAGDVADAVAHALAHDVRGEFDLVEAAPHTLRDIVVAFRAWLGFAPAAAQIDVPRWAGYAIARLADGAGWLGWRAPLRTTALRVLSHDVSGSGAAWTKMTGRRLMSLGETLATLPATAQERLFARTQLVFPLLIITLAGFWLATGVIALQQQDAAVAVLHGRIAPNAARALVVGGAILDMAIGVGLVVRATLQRAAWAAIAVSLAYLVAGTLLTPELWADPLGPLVKIAPSMALALAVAALAQER